MAFDLAIPGTPVPSHQLLCTGTAKDRLRYGRPRGRDDSMSYAMSRLSASQRASANELSSFMDASPEKSALLLEHFGWDVEVSWRCSGCTPLDDLTVA